MGDKSYGAVHLRVLLDYRFQQRQLKIEKSNLTIISIFNKGVTHHYTWQRTVIKLYNHQLQNLGYKTK